MQPRDCRWADDPDRAFKKAVPDNQHRLWNFIQISSSIQACFAREAFAGETRPSDAPLRFA